MLSVYFNPLLSMDVSNEVYAMSDALQLETDAITWSGWSLFTTTEVLLVIFTILLSSSNLLVCTKTPSELYINSAVGL